MQKNLSKAMLFHESRIIMGLMPSSMTLKRSFSCDHCEFIFLPLYFFKSFAVTWKFVIKHSLNFGHFWDPSSKRSFLQLNQFLERDRSISPEKLITLPFASLLKRDPKNVQSRDNLIKGFECQKKTPNKHSFGD